MKHSLKAEQFNYLSENDFRLVRLSNVIEVDHSRDSINVITDDGPEIQGSPAYFIIDNDSHAAFAHFVYESGIHLQAFHDLVKIHPDLQIVLKEKRTFKDLFIQFFKISKDRISYNIESRENICYFPPNINLHQKTSSDYFKTLLNRYIEKIDETISNQGNPILYMPRQTKENFGPNDRSFKNTEELKQFIDSKQGTILNTDSISNLEAQISQVKSAQRILLDYGSSYYVNGLFAQNASILVIGDLRQHVNYPMMSTLHEAISGRNRVNILDWIQVGANTEITLDVPRLKAEIEKTFTADCLPSNAPKKRKITVIGNSHSAVFQELGLTHKYRLHIEQTNSLTMYATGSDREISAHINSLTLSDTSLLFSVFGEIDLRNSIKYTGETINEILDIVALNYCEYLLQLKKNVPEMIVCITGATPQVTDYSKKDLHSSSLMDKDSLQLCETVEWVKILNNRLAAQAYEKGFIFLDLCKLYEDFIGPPSIAKPEILKEAVWHILNYTEEYNWSRRNQ